MTEVYEKWGFGMAPPKPQVQTQRLIAAAYVGEILAGKRELQTESERELVSMVKGLFSRVFKEDQWDWFTVRGQLGYPSPRIAKTISEYLYLLRRASTFGDSAAYRDAALTLRKLPTRKCLSVFMRETRIAGWIYALSTREYKDLLKIGMTTRSVEARVREINSATGVAIPYGVRGCWRVRSPAVAERLVHLALNDYRVRGDREFFRGDFQIISGLIRKSLSAEGLEMRTLDNLAALGC